MRRLVLALAGLPPLVQDLLLALALAAVYVGTLVPYRSHVHPFWLAAALAAAETLPLAARRSYPFATFLVIGAARVSYDLVPLSFAPAPIAPALAYFTIIDRCRPAARRVATALLVIGIAVSQLAPGHTEPYDITVPALIFLSAGMAGVLSRIWRASAEKVEARAARAEAERDEQTARAASAERTRIARELHDVVAHHVSLMAVQAEAATSLLPGRPAEAARSVEIIGTTARQALTELRRLLAVLRGPGDGPQTAPAVSLADIGGVLEKVRASGLPVEYSVQGTACQLSPGTDLTAYRIIQEALTNTVRHAHASRAAVSVRYEPGFVIVRVTDTSAAAHAPVPPGNGAAGQRPAGAGKIGPAGGDPALASSGLGLAGITERVASCRGTLTVGPTGHGFAVTARLPAP